LREVALRRCNHEPGVVIAKSLKESIFQSLEPGAEMAEVTEVPLILKHLTREVSTETCQRCDRSELSITSVTSGQLWAPFSRHQRRVSVYK
jgi:hypothetical protein